MLLRHYRFWILYGLGLVAAAGFVSRSVRAHWRGKGAQERFERLCRHDFGDARVVDFTGVGELPDCVQRYFHYALSPSQLGVKSARISQSGTIRLGNGERSWRPFCAEEVASIRPRGFIWSARVRLIRGIKLRLLDSYLGFEGHYEASALGFAHSAEGEEVTSAALVRFLAETVWCPTALLPSAGVRWTACGEDRAVARLVDGENFAELEFPFGENFAELEFPFDEGGRVTSVFSAGRFRQIGNHFELTPWEAFVSHYERRNGMMVPARAAIHWHLPAGRLPVWVGRLDSITFDFGKF